MPNQLIENVRRNYNLEDGQSRRCFLTTPKSRNGPFRLQSLAMALFVRERDIDPDVLWLRSEPGLIKVPFKGKVLRYWPDFEIGWRNGTTSLTEVKSAARRYDDTLRARFRRVGEHCSEAGVPFDLIFSDRLYRQPKRRNVGLIHYYKDTPVTERQLELVLRQLDLTPEPTIDELVKGCPSVRRQQLYALVAKGHLWVNLFKLVDGNAPIRKRRISLDLAA